MLHLFALNSITSITDMKTIIFFYFHLCDIYFYIFPLKIFYLNFQSIVSYHLQLDCIKKKKPWGFPGGAVVGSLPADVGDAGSSPGLGGSRMPRSGWAREPQLLSLRVWSLCPATGGAAVVRGPRTAMKSGPRTAM